MWFDMEKGFGVIKALEPIIESTVNLGVTNSVTTREIFLHIKNWTDTVPLDCSQAVPLVFESAFERNRLTAKKCEFFKGTKQNWVSLFSNLGINETLSIEGNHSVKTYNIVEVIFKNLKNNFEPTPLYEALDDFLIQIPIEQLFIKTKTLLEIRKGTSSIILKNLLDEIIFKHFQKIDSLALLDLWKRSLIPISVISDEELEKLSSQIHINDLAKIKEQKGDGELCNKIIMNWIRNLQSKFDYESFCSFQQIIPIIEGEACRNKAIKELSLIGQPVMFTRLNFELKGIGVIQGQRELKHIDVIKKAIPNFISSEFENEIQTTLEYFIAENSSSDGLIDACLKGYFKEPESIIRKKIDFLTVSSFKKLVKSKILFEPKFIIELLEKLSLSCSKFELVLEVSFLLERTDLHKRFDENIFSRVSEEVYFTYWVKGIGKILPENYIVQYFDEKLEKYKESEDWIKRGLVTSQELNKIFEKRLKQIVRIENRKDFQTLFSLVQNLVEMDNRYIENIQKANSPFQILVLWFLGYIEEVDFEILKGKFIYFTPLQQVRVVKKIFRLIALGKINLTPKRLNELIRADLDLFSINEKFNSEVILDLSTSIIIESILKFESEGKFLVESELLSTVLRGISSDKTKRFQLSDYFAECQGRMVAEFNWKSKGNISKVPFGENKYYFAISFPSGQNVRVGRREVFVANPDFGELKEAVKSLPGRKWNSENEHWGVPSKYEKEVLAFARSYRLTLNFEGNKYANNIHLCDYIRKELPNGIKYCEGQMAKENHKQHNKFFWWCNNAPCFENVENIHNCENWENYTLLDFLKILKLDVLEEGRYGRFEIGKYNQFISQINRFNELLGRLYCRECNQILYPIESSNYAAYGVVRFCCENSECKEFKNTVYLNHCLNSKCKSIIDSRNVKKCPNGLYICQECGSCCSLGMFIRRLSNLQETGGLVYRELKLKIDNKEGHLERAEYYCHSCGQMMYEVSPEIFKCMECDVKYDTRQFGFERENRFLRRIDYPTSD